MTVIQSSLTKFPPPTFNDVVSEVQGYDSKLQSYEEVHTVTPHADSILINKLNRLDRISVVEVVASNPTAEEVATTHEVEASLSTIAPLTTMECAQPAKSMEELVTLP